jgi:hypothetical protein
LAGGPAAIDLDAWLTALGVEVSGVNGGPGDPAQTRDLVLDGERRFDLPVTVAWVDGIGLNLWAHYGPDGMEAPRRVLLEMLRANGEYPLVKFGLTDEDRPLLLTELPVEAAGMDALGRALVRLIIVADRLLDVTAQAVAARGILPDWDGRTGRNPDLLARYRQEVEASLPPWSAPAAVPPRPRRSLWRRRAGG